MDHRSLWQKTVSAPARASVLEDDIHCDAVIVGAGLTGILTAWMLQEQGFDVVILDSGVPGQGATAHTTAKITALHGFYYSKLISSYGIETAKLYLQANQHAIARYAELIQTHDFACDFQKVNGFLYSRSPSHKIEEEFSALKSLAASPCFTTKTQLPFSVSAALSLNDQAIFHPLKFINSLLSCLRIYQNSTVKKISNQAVICDQAVVTAKHIVVATRYPFFLYPGFFFARMHQERSYALSITDIAAMDDMYIDINHKGVTFRPWCGQIILSGFSHRTGHKPSQNGYDALHHCAQHWYPGYNSTAQWSAEDSISSDQIPYIGSYEYSGSKIHVATGFCKWGMSTAMIAAEVISDSICGNKNRFARLFSPHRSPDAKTIAAMLHDGAISIGNLTKEVLYYPRTKLHQIPPGQGEIIQFSGKKAGVYHHPNGTLYFVSTKCPHMGCQLSWNPAECTWDCPCHGSRFSYDGTPLDPPAKSALPCTVRKV